MKAYELELEHNPWLWTRQQIEDDSRTAYLADCQTVVFQYDLWAHKLPKTSRATNAAG